MKFAPIIDPNVRKPAPKPVRVDLRIVFGIGTALWAIAAVICVIAAWMGANTLKACVVCVTGVIIGLLLLLWEYFDRWDYRRLGL